MKITHDLGHPVFSEQFTPILLIEVLSRKQKKVHRLICLEAWNICSFLFEPLYNPIVDIIFFASEIIIEILQISFCDIHHNNYNSPKFNVG